MHFLRAGLMYGQCQMQVWHRVRHVMMNVHCAAVRQRCQQGAHCSCKQSHNRTQAENTSTLAACCHVCTLVTGSVVLEHHPSQCFKLSTAGPVKLALALLCFSTCLHVSCRP